MKATEQEAKKRIAKEITDNLRYQAPDGFFVFADARRQWEDRCEGDFDSLVTELIFSDNAWLKDSYRGQQRHGQGYRNDAGKQFVKLYIF